MKEMICIVCPKGCHLKIDEATYQVTGNACPRGAEYAKNELTHPVRVLTSTVKIEGAMYRRCPVRTASAVPKGAIHEIMQLLNDVCISAPAEIGDVVLENAAGTGVNVIVTKNM